MTAATVATASDRRTRPTPLPARPAAGSRLAAGLVTAGAAVAVACYLAVAVARIHTPAGLEWMEGGIALHVQRVLHGHSVYGPPSTAFTPYLYTPLYYYVSAPFAAVLGSGLAPLRLVSLLASVALLGLVAALVRRETGRWWAGAGAAGLLAACFGVSGAWLDLARVDTLSLALAVASLYLVRAGRRWPSAVAAGVLAAAAVMTKQVALAPALAVVPFLLRADRRRAASYGAALAAGLGASVGVLQWTSHGWFWFYAVRIPLHHQVVRSEIAGFWTNDIGSRLWPALAVAVAVGAVTWRGRGRPWRGRRGWSPGVWFYLPVLASLVVAAWVGRLHSGGYDNVLLPAYAAVAVLFGLATSRLDRLGRPAAAVAAACVVALGATLAYNPARQVPGPAQAAAAGRLVAELRALPGPVYLPGHPWYLARAGKPPVAQTAAVEDVLRADIGHTGARLDTALAAQMAARRFGALVVESDTSLTVLPADTCRFYAPAYRLPGWRALLPVTGTSTAPATVWLPRTTPGPATCPQGRGHAATAGAG